MSKAEKIKVLRGMEDIFGERADLFRAIENNAQEIFSRYHYQRIITPIVEELALFARGVGEKSDVVNKEMYSFEDRSGNKICLRPEGTASTARAYIQHSMNARESISKLFYLGPMFRYERPQKGRNRQFYQLGVELLGSSSPYADCEVMAMTAVFFQALGLNNIQLEINSLGSAKDRELYNQELKKFLEGKLDDFSEAVQERAEQNPLRLFDSKDPKMKELMSKAPRIKDFFSDESRAQFALVQEELINLGVEFLVNEDIVRGLDYYTGVAFEFTSNDLGSQNAVAAGGRYDGLIAELGGPEVPGVGMAMGLERIMLLLEANGWKPSSSEQKIYLAPLCEAAIGKISKFAETLRAKAFHVVWEFETRSLKSQMKKADKLGADYVVMLGEDELSQDKYCLRNMNTKEQNLFSKEDVIKQILRNS